MKKLVPFLLTILLLAGCFGGSGPADDEENHESDTTESTESNESTESKIIEAEFVAISAEILCLPQNFPEAVAEDIEAKAKEIATKHGITGEEYQAYQKSLETDSEDKTRVGYAIVGKMGEFCNVDATTSDEGATSSETAATEGEAGEQADDTEVTDGVETAIDTEFNDDVSVETVDATVASDTSDGIPLESTDSTLVPDDSMDVAPDPAVIE